MNSMRNIENSFGCFQRNAENILIKGHLKNEVALIILGE